MRSWEYDEEPIRCREFWPEVHWPTAKGCVVSGARGKGRVARRLYCPAFGQIKERICSERLRVVSAANEAMVLLYWDVGKAILGRQEQEGWGAKTIDRLSHDLREAFPDLRGFSPRNLKYMRTFASVWPDRELCSRLLHKFRGSTIASFSTRCPDRANPPVVRQKVP